VEVGGGVRGEFGGFFDWEGVRRREGGRMGKGRDVRMRLMVGFLVLNWPRVDMM
jgi:hypothetical protein